MPSGGLYATYHLLGEPETTIDPKLDSLQRFLQVSWALEVCYLRRHSAAAAALASARGGAAALASATVDTEESGEERVREAGNLGM